MHYAKWKQPDSKVYILYDSIHTVFWKIEGEETDEWLPGSEGGERVWPQRAQGNFVGNGIILYLDCVVVMWRYAFVFLYVNYTSIFKSI